MRLELFSVGTELLLGEIVDTNAAYLAQKLSELGVNVYYKTTVGDNAERLAAALRTSLERADAVLATGGLGPTEDDITAAAVAEVMGEPLVEDEGAAERIRSVVRQRGLKLLDSRRPPGAAATPEGLAGWAPEAPLLRQACVPRGAIVVPNPVGTAAGFILPKNGKTVIVLPGVPSEMRAMAEQTVLPYLAGRMQAEGAATLVSRVLRFAGIGESQAEAEIRDLIAAQSNPTIAPLAKTGEVHLRLTARAASRDEALALIAPIEAEIRRRLGEFIYGADDETLEVVVGRLLRAAGLTVAVAESCTGGLIGHRLTNVPGSSDYLLASLVTYSNEAKASLLGGGQAESLRHLISRHGAVSAECAAAMAEGARRVCGADIGLSVTGIAGPTGGTPEKPVGLVYLGLADATGVATEERRLGGDRLMVKERAAHLALYLLYRHLRKRAEGER
jgi:nicotinamide-nucleotide amidase